jgi:hypothetical protein
MADAPDLGSGAARRVGSSPTFRTKEKPVSVLKTETGFFLFEAYLIKATLQLQRLPPPH